MVIGVGVSDFKEMLVKYPFQANAAAALRPDFKWNPVLGRYQYVEALENSNQKEIRNVCRKLIEDKGGAR